MNLQEESQLRKIVRTILLEKKADARGADEVKKAIDKSRNFPEEHKEYAKNNLKSYSTYFSSGVVTGLELHPDLKKKIKEKDLPDGFDMGIDKKGFFISTHRARSKSYENPGDISIKDIKFIDSTG